MSQINIWLIFFELFFQPQSTLSYFNLERNQYLNIKFAKLQYKALRTFEFYLNLIKNSLRSLRKPLLPITIGIAVKFCRTLSF